MVRFRVSSLREPSVVNAGRLSVTRVFDPSVMLEHVWSPRRSSDETSSAVIADASGVISLGGIMGGQTTAVNDYTKNVFVECALFDPVRVALTGRRQQLHSDARARFERGVLHHFVRLDGPRRSRAKREGDEKREVNEAHDHCAGCASEPPPAFARAAAPKRSRRSASDRAPPSAMAPAPSQISVTKGFQ